MSSDVVTVFTGGIRLTVKAKPGIAKARALKIVDIGDGKRALEIAVAAAAEDGKANRAIIERLADLLGARKADIEIMSGATARHKIVEIRGDAGNLRGKLDALTGGNPD